MSFEVLPLAGGAYLVRLQSEDGRNRLDLDLLARLADCPAVYPDARRFVLTGNERHFSVGADLNAIFALESAVAWNLSRQGQRSLNRIADSSVPFIAAIDGYCLGGGLDLALACRARVVTPRAYLGHHGAKLGLVTGWAGTQRLPRLIGRARALDHLLTATGWTAEQAVAEGLATIIVSPETLLARAAALD